MKDIFEDLPGRVKAGFAVSFFVWAAGFVLLSLFAMKAKDMERAAGVSRTFAGALAGDYAAACVYGSVVGTLSMQDEPDISQVRARVESSGGVFEAQPVSSAGSSGLDRVRFRASWRSVSPSDLSDIMVLAESLFPPMRVSAVRITTKRKGAEENSPVEASLEFEYLRRRKI